MKEPTTAKYPNGYDDETTLFGTLKNTRMLTVRSAIDVDSITLTVNEDCSDLQTPIYLVFESGEIWFVQQGGLSQNTQGYWQFTLETNENQRAIHGSPLQPHMVNERVYIGLLSSHFNQLKQVLMAAQRYHFRVGTDAERQALMPEVGERFLCSDTKRIYYCFQAGTWTWANRVRHGDLTGLADNDHPQYIQEAGSNAWHSALGGGHMTAGDNHDHKSTGQGAPVEKIRAGAYSAIGSPVVAGDLYFATDVDGGTLFVSINGVQWEKVAGVPAGAIALFAGACPPGWSRYTALDGRFPYGSATSGAVGGYASHKHTYTDVMKHYHVVAAQSLTLSSGGSHSHVVTSRNNSGGSSDALAVYGGDSSKGTSSNGSHTHSVTRPAYDVNSAGTASAETSEASNLPPYQEMVFCKKD